ncbi:MAG: hypothetical protein K2X08_01960, partial [Chlamydiales bacterium]|nr:hypothetical protein [Chlamydiales bacterium]
MLSNRKKINRWVQIGIGLCQLTIPSIIQASNFQWAAVEGLDTSDLNTNTNWNPNGFPGSSDDVFFDNTSTLDVILTPTASDPFSISTINFVNSAKAFSFIFDNTSLQLNGSGILGVRTNTSMTLENNNNSSLLSNQVEFANVISNTSGMAAWGVSNIGTLSNASLLTVSVVTNQIYAAGPLIVEKDGSMVVSNTGILSGTASSGYNVIGVASGQILCNDFYAEDSFTLTVTNEGIDSSTGSGGNQIGYVGLASSSSTPYSQLLLTGGGDVVLLNDVTFTLTNNGNFSGVASSAKDYLGYVSQSQLLSNNTFQAGDRFSLYVTNSGTEAGGADTASNATGHWIGYVAFPQIEFASTLTLANQATIEVSNTGTNTSYARGVNTGIVHGEQFYMNSEPFVAGDELRLNATNLGFGENATGYIGWCPVASSQVSCKSATNVGDQAQISVVNKGTYSGNEISNPAFVGGGYKNQVHLNISTTGRNVLEAGDFFSLKISNQGTDSSLGVGGNQIGYITSDGDGQLYIENNVDAAAVVKNDATFNITNVGVFEGENTLDSNSIGYIGGDQVSVTIPFESGNRLTFYVTNSGDDTSSGVGGNYVGYVEASQMSFASSVALGDDASITVLNSG